MKLLFSSVFGLLLCQNSLAWLPQTLPFKFQGEEHKTESKRRLQSSALSATVIDQPLRLYDSKTRTKQEFHPLDGNDDKEQPSKKTVVKMYTCGPTVYDFAHIGNFRAFLTYDLLKRVLMYLGYDVRHVCNITDVDDKILMRANEQQLATGTIGDLTQKFETAFLKDLKVLNCIPATIYPRATEHVPAMIRFIQDLALKGLAYSTADGSWYFDTQKQPGYGQQLVELNYDDMVQQKLTENADGKKHFADFCLWKAYKEGLDRADAAWESSTYETPASREATAIHQPWPLAEPIIGLGRPGWHLECSAMARTYFGDETIDFHGGGIDLKFPHHENEIAQSQGLSEKNFCDCWFHNGFVNMGDEKMSKSLGNFLTLADVCPTPLDIRAYRYMVISSQYRNALNFSKKAMNDAKKLVKRIDKVKAEIEAALLGVANSEGTNSSLADKVVPAALESFEVAIRDDLSMPRASATLISVVKSVEQEFKRKHNDEEHSLDTVGLKSALAAIEKMNEVFGIIYDVAPTYNTEASEEAIVSVPEEVMALVGQRSLAKESKDWELADSLRQRISELGFEIKDVKDGDPIVTPVDG